MSGGFGNTPTTTTQGTLTTNQFPISEVYVPNTANGNLTALQGGPSSTDGLGNTSAPVATYAADGSNVTQGTSTDANTANTVMGRLTKLRDILLGLIGQQIKASSLSVTIASDQTAVPVSGTFWQATQPVSGTVSISSLPTSPTGTPSSVAASISPAALLASNVNRKGATIYNESSATLYLGLFAHTSLTTSAYTVQIPSNNLYELPTGNVYTGEISGVWSSAAGYARITEMS